MLARFGMYPRTGGNTTHGHHKHRTPWKSPVTEQKLRNFRLTLVTPVREDEHHLPWCLRLLLLTRLHQKGSLRMADTSRPFPREEGPKRGHTEDAERIFTMLPEVKVKSVVDADRIAKRPAVSQSLGQHEEEERTTDRKEDI